MTQLSINQACPFSGKPVQENAMTELEGKTIGFCNPGCRDKFAAHPENYPQVLAEFFPAGRLNVYDAKSFIADKEWGSQHVATLNGVGVKVHTTTTPYHWHVNQGQEVFVVLKGEVEMRYERDGATFKSILLHEGMLAHMEPGCEHVAHPKGRAHILVIEQLGEA